MTATPAGRRAELARLTVAPDPVRGTVIVRLTDGPLEPGQVRMTDAAGRVVPANPRRVAGSLHLATQSWAPGTD